ncbi:MAG: SDR family NAD(P)-dependent oxidoreductase [Chloroflexi bacterium]|nr:SDR family NAD(P)-dependent oxidoreductase [Chloroflexota bacterium]
MSVTGLENKTVLVTGSSKGIGRGVVVESARAGANVVINHRDSEAEAEEARRIVEDLGRKALVVRADLGVQSDVDAMFDEAIDTFGGVDVAVHSAYYSYREFAVDLPFDEWKRTIDVSLSGAFLMAQHTARDLIRRETSGSIIFIGSIQAIRCPPRSAPYNSAKNGLRGLTYTLACELAPHGIRVNLIEPGWIDTPGERKYATQQQIDEGAKDLPFKRLGTPEEIANGVLFLASDMGSYVSGETLRIDAATWLPRAHHRL